MTAKLRDPKVVVIGAGMTGILVAIKLQEAGISGVEILEKTDRLGGTWRENTYPGVACDIPAPSYAYSFEPNPNFSHRFARGGELQKYFEDTACKYGVADKIAFNESVDSAIYDSGKWTVTTSKQRVIVADFIINCTGILHHPAKPKIAGLDKFTGAIFHTAEWDHSVDLSGKKVGIIGVGSTAAQVIPEVAKVAGTLKVFQRTPQWILPLGDKQVSEKTKKLYRRFPLLLRMVRKAQMWSNSQLLTKAVTGHKLQTMLFSYVCKRNLKRSVKDPELRKKLTPNYQVGCKRIVISTKYYDAIQRDNVELVTDGIDYIDERGIQTKQDGHHQLDVLILSTGFNPTAYMRPMDLRGNNGVRIDDSWNQKIRTYRSVCMPDYPNNFLMLGPNTPIGNYSVTLMSEVQTKYILQLIERWRKQEFDAIEPKATAVDEFHQHIKQGMQGTVWLGGCQSWYLDADGDPILWPYTWEQWVSEMERPDMTRFDCASFAPA